MRTLNKILLFSCLCFLFSCEAETKKSDTKSTELKDLKTSDKENISFTETLSHLTISKISPRIYEQELQKSEKRILAEKFCFESQGYQSDTWKGLNDCSWAIEKYKILENKDRVKKEKNQLILQLANGKTFDLEYNLSDVNDGNYFQFLAYLPKAKVYCIKVAKKDACPKYWLINSGNGNKTILNGFPYFSGNEQSILVLSGNNNTKSNCANTLELKKIENEKLKHLWEYKAKDWFIDEMIWLNDTELFISQRNDTEQHFAKLKLL